MSSLLQGLKVKPELVAIEDIETNTFVRAGISDDRVEFLGLLVTAGTVLEPILVAPEYEVDAKGHLNFIGGSKKRSIVDGRHRLRMEDVLLDHSQVKCLTIIGGLENEAQLIALAFRANNVGGPLPPDQQDINHTVELLLEKKVPKKDIPALLGLPEVAVRKFIGDVEARLDRAKTYRAYKLVVNKAVSIPEAAKEVGTTPEKVRNFVAAGRRKRKQSDMEDVKREISHTFKSLSSKVQITLRLLSKKYDDGDVVSQDVLEVFKNIEGYQSRQAKVVKDLRQRFESKLGGNGSAK